MKNIKILGDKVCHRVHIKDFIGLFKIKRKSYSNSEASWQRFSYWWRPKAQRRSQVPRNQTICSKMKDSAKKLPDLSKIRKHISLLPSRIRVRRQQEPKNQASHISHFVIFFLNNKWSYF